MAQPKKLSGADLAAQLGELSTFSVPHSTAEIAPGPARLEASNGDAGPPPIDGVVQDTSDPVPPSPPRPHKSQGGRPSKAGADGIPLNVRLSQSDHLALARLAGNLLVPGRPMPTVQDVVRGLIRGALQEPEAALRLVRQADLF